VISTRDSDIVDFLSRSFAEGANYDDIRDHLMFDFNCPEDIHVFARQHFKVNLCLFGKDYLCNNVNY
jgi:hypothetical protein